VVVAVPGVCPSCSNVSATPTSGFATTATNSRTRARRRRRLSRPERGSRRASQWQTTPAACLKLWSESCAAGPEDEERERIAATSPSPVASCPAVGSVLARSILSWTVSCAADMLIQLYQTQLSFVKLSCGRPRPFASLRLRILLVPNLSHGLVDARRAEGGERDALPPLASTSASVTVGPSSSPAATTTCAARSAIHGPRASPRPDCRPRRSRASVRHHHDHARRPGPHDQSTRPAVRKPAGSGVWSPVGSDFRCRAASVTLSVGGRSTSRIRARERHEPDRVPVLVGVLQQFQHGPLRHASPAASTRSRPRRTTRAPTNHRREPTAGDPAIRRTTHRARSPHAPTPPRPHSHRQFQRPSAPSVHENRSRPRSATPTRDRSRTRFGYRLRWRQLRRRRLPDVRAVLAG